MVAVTQWTNADLAQMTQLASDIAQEEYCTHCQVVLVADSSVLCDGCMEEVTAYLEESEASYYARMAEEATYQAQWQITA